jgi:hypothetical protein
MVPYVNKRQVQRFRVQGSKVSEDWGQRTEDRRQMTEDSGI